MTLSPIAPLDERSAPAKGPHFHRELFLFPDPIELLLAFSADDRGRCAVREAGILQSCRERIELLSKLVELSPRLGALPVDIDHSAKGYKESRPAGENDHRSLCCTVGG